MKRLGFCGFLILFASAMAGAQGSQCTGCRIWQLAYPGCDSGGQHYNSHFVCTINGNGWCSCSTSGSCPQSAILCTPLGGCSNGGTCVDCCPGCTKCDPVCARPVDSLPAAEMPAWFSDSSTISRMVKSLPILSHIFENLKETMTINRDNGLTRGGVYIDPESQEVFNFTVLIGKDGGMAIILPKHVLRVSVATKKWNLMGGNAKIDEGDLPDSTPKESFVNDQKLR
jgi:hypothetical protein